MNIERENIPDLTIELMEGATGGLILLEQDSGGNTDRVAIHPIQLRYLAEKFGLVATSDPLAQKTIATLTRRLHLLRDRIDFLDDYLVTCSDNEHADLSYEQTYARATADIAGEFCADFDDQPGAALDESDRVPAPTPPPIVQKVAVAVPDKPAPYCANAADAGDAAILAAIQGAPNGITRPALIAALSGQHGRTKIYDGVAELVRTGVVRDSSGILSAQRGRTADGLRTDAHTDAQPSVAPGLLV